MASNQIHYKTLRGKVTEEYEDVLGARSYVAALLGQNDKGTGERDGSNQEEGLKLVSYRKNRERKRKVQLGTIFVAKIPEEASARELWNFFKIGGEVVDIVLPRKKKQIQQQDWFF